MTRYYAAACQVDLENPRRRDDMAASTTRMLGQLEQTVVGYRPFHDVKLVAFPEFAHAAPIYETPEEILEKLAVEIPNEHTERIAAKARELGVYVQSGSFLEVDPRWPDAVFNTTCLIGPDGLLSRYRKTHPWLPWEVHSSPHDIEDYPDEVFPVTETEIGHLAVATCYDWLFPEVIRELALGGAEVVVRVSAYMDPWGATPPMDWWTLINRSRAVENLVYVVAANQGATEGRFPPFSWPGGSMIVDPDGRILAEAPPGPGERTVIAPIDLGSLRAERARRIGHSMPTHLRTELYTRQQRPVYPPNRGPAAHHVEAIEESIRDSQRRMGWR